MMLLFALLNVGAGIPLPYFTERNNYLVGASSISVLPTVNGTTDYIPVLDEFDAYSAGLFVLEFDVGRVPIGNGDTDAHWVRDDIRATAVAIKGENEITVVFLHANLYMLFVQDLQHFYDLVRDEVGDDVYANIRIVVSATHNHEGPDTSGLSVINPRYYEYMLNQLKIITLEALSNMQPASLRVSDSAWRFGQGDNRDPRVVDPIMNVLQATSLSNGAVIATLIQWTFHPEIGAFFNPIPKDEECAALGEGPGCSARGRTFHGDYPGNIQKYAAQLTGGEVLYMSGALGVQIGPNQNAITPAPVWEVSEEFPISGDGSIAPPNATLVPKSYRQSLLVGREAAYQALRSLNSERASEVAFGPIKYTATTTYSRISNVLFRAGLAPGYVLDRPILLGYSLRPLFVCQPGLPPSDETCVSDNYERVPYNGFDLPVRKGDFAQLYVSQIEIDTIKMASIPGELSPELAHGLPEDFDVAANSKYYINPDQHALGANYTLEGVLKDMMKCKYCWMQGLTHDAGGYILPISDFRMSCVGDICEPGGYITGERCKQVLDSGVREGPEFNNCYLGQISQWGRHYEEILSGSWDAAGDLIKAHARLLGVEPSGRFSKPDWTK